MSSTQVERNEFSRYLAEAKSWETDRLAGSEKSKRIAWAIAIVASGIALILSIATAGLIPLKTTELKVIRVDNNTGIVDVVTELADAKSDYGEAVNKYFAQMYLRYREGYSRDLAEDYYTNVGLMSAANEQRRYADYFSPKNPLSPLNVYGSTARVKVRVKSVSFIKSDVALVRYLKEVERGGTDRPAVTHWAATVAFRYSGAPASEKDRAVNPLGFQVTEYRNDPDAAIGADVSSPTAPVPFTPATAEGAPAGVTLFPGVPPLPSRAATGQVPAILP